MARYYRPAVGRSQKDPSRYAFYALLVNPKAGEPDKFELSCPSGADCERFIFDLNGIPLDPWNLDCGIDLARCLHGAKWTRAGAEETYLQEQVILSLLAWLKQHHPRVRTCYDLTPEIVKQFHGFLQQSVSACQCAMFYAQLCRAWRWIRESHPRLPDFPDLSVQPEAGTVAAGDTSLNTATTCQPKHESLEAQSNLESYDHDDL